MQQDCAGRNLHNTPPPPRDDPVGPNFSHHKARVQAVGWFPVGDQETGEQTSCCPPPPPPKQKKDREGDRPSTPPPTPRPQQTLCILAARWHMASAVPPLTEGRKHIQQHRAGLQQGNSILEP